MILDSFIIHGLLCELNTSLQTAQVRQIHQTDPRIIDMELFRPGSGSFHLILSAYTPPVFYIKKNGGTYGIPQTFCMTLRKHLEGSRFSGAEQIHMDRIVCFNFDRIEAMGRIITKKLYVEMIPSAPNLVLTENGVILDACVKSRKAQRQLSSQSPYSLPVNNNRLDFLQFSQKETEDLLQYASQTDQTVKEWIFSVFNGFSMPVAEELCFRCSIQPDTRISQLSPDTEKQIAETIDEFRTVLSQDPQPKLYVYGGKDLLSLIPMSSLKESDTPVASINAYIEAMYADAGSLPEDRLRQAGRLIASAVKKEKRKIGRISAEMDETEHMDQYKLCGDLLSIYSWMQPQKKEEITVPNLFTESQEPMTIPLQPEFSLIRNSQMYYKKYNKLKTRMGISREKLAESEQRLSYLQNLAYFAGEIHTPEDLEDVEEEIRNAGICRQEVHGKNHRKKEAGLPSLLSFDMDGYTVHIGRNSKQNEYLTCRKAKEEDLWFHARLMPGAHVVVTASGKTGFSEDIIRDAAAAAAWFSSGRDSGKVDVDCTRIRHVKKVSGGPPGLVTYTGQKTISAVPQNPIQDQK